MSGPYYADEHVRLYLGDCRELLPTLGETYDAAIVDPPYGETSLGWDRWPSGWPAAVAAVTSSMWCFGSLRMFLAHGAEFGAAGWWPSQDVVWEKHNGTGFAADRFKGVHELCPHFYRGRWDRIYHEVPRTVYTGPDKHSRSNAARVPHTGQIGALLYTDDGTRLARSVQRHPSVRGGLHPTEKPVPLLTPLIAYAVPPDGGLVLDPMAGSCSTAVAARLSGRRAVCIEAHEPYLEAAARRLDQGVLDVGSDAS